MNSASWAAVKLVLCTKQDVSNVGSGEPLCTHPVPPRTPFQAAILEQTPCEKMIGPAYGRCASAVHHPQLGIPPDAAFTIP